MRPGGTATILVTAFGAAACSIGALQGYTGGGDEPRESDAATPSPSGDAAAVGTTPPPRDAGATAVDATCSRETTEWRAPRAAESVGPGLGFVEAPWTSPMNALRADDRVAETMIISTGVGRSHDLVVRDFGFQVPQGASILGVEVEVTRESRDREISDDGVRLRLGNGWSPSSRASAAPWSLGSETVVYGGEDELFGAGLAPALVDTPAFGVGIAVRTNASGSFGAAVDAVRARIHYCR